MRLMPFLSVLCPFSVLLPILAFAPPALADEARPSPMPATERLTLEQFGTANKACREWTDGCAVCLHRDDGTFGCSLPGIACLPVAVSCRPSPVTPKPTPPAPEPAPKNEAPH